MGVDTCAQAREYAAKYFPEQKDVSQMRLGFIQICIDKGVPEKDLAVLMDEKYNPAGLSLLTQAMTDYSISSAIAAEIIDSSVYNPGNQNDIDTMGYNVNKAGYLMSLVMNFGVDNARIAFIPEISTRKTEQIYLGFKNGLSKDQVCVYAEKDCVAKKMEEVRKALQQGAPPALLEPVVRFRDSREIKAMRTAAMKIMLEKGDFPFLMCDDAVLESVDKYIEDGMTIQEIASLTGITLKDIPRPEKIFEYTFENSAFIDRTLTSPSAVRLVDPAKVEGMIKEMDDIGNKGKKRLEMNDPALFCEVREEEIEEDQEDRIV